MAHFSIPKVAQVLSRAGVMLAVIIAVFGFNAAAQPVQASDRMQSGCTNLVAIAAPISIDTTWTSGNIYYVSDIVVVSSGVTLTIEPGTVIKMDDGANLDVQGTLLSLGTSGSEVLFTSVHDDSDGCDIDGDGNNILPQRGDWGAVKIKNDNNGVAVTGLVVSYATEGLVVSQISTTLSPFITANTFSFNSYGLTIVVNHSGESTALVSQNAFTDNEYGFYVRRQSTSNTGIARPVLEDNDFASNIIRNCSGW